MPGRRQSALDLVREWRLPPGERAAARAARRQAKLDASVRGRAAAVEAEARRFGKLQDH